MTLPDNYRLCDDAFDVDAIHAYLTRSYWSPGIPRDTVARAIEGSHCVSVMKDGPTVGFARVVTDHATFAYLADVYVLENECGKGLASAMIGYFHDHPGLQGLRRWMLATRDAHALYARHGWAAVHNPGILMQRHFPDVYSKRAKT